MKKQENVGMSGLAPMSVGMSGLAPMSGTDVILSMDITLNLKHLI